ncbi:MAG: fuculose phosphate aldolase [Candidatus Omnitrophica bacterium]|nr:fuculose phosphate aldolase [Candidatus Omnitrophota bacterium]
MIDKTGIVHYGKQLHKHGLVIGAGGNLSVREKDRVLIKKKGADMSHGMPGSYVETDLSGLDPSANRLLSSEALLHAACYSLSDKINAVAHTHSPYSIAAADKFKELRNISYEFECLTGGSVPVLEYIEPGSKELGDAVAEKISEGARAVLLKKHGPVAIGADLKEAFLRVLAIERASISALHG